MRKGKFGSNTVQLIRKHIGEPQRIAELGVWKAVTAEVVLEAFPNVYYCAIDPYQELPPDHPFRQHRFGRMAQKEYDLAKHEAVERLARFSHVQWYFLPEEKMVHEHELDTPFDVVMVDANHDVASVRGSIERWWPYVRPGGLMVGDDYGASHPGVPAAVTSFAAGRNLLVDVLPGKTWYILKANE